MPLLYKYSKIHEAFFKRHGELLWYKKGQLLVSPVEQYPWVYFLVSGYVRSSFTLSDGTPRIIGFFRPGTTFAQSGSFFDDEGGKIEYTAETSASLYRIKRSDFFLQLGRDPEFAQEYLDMVLRSRIYLIERIIYQGENGVERKFARWLLFMIKYYCTHEKEGCRILIPLTQTTIANFLHITRESANATIRNFEKKKLLKIVKKHIVIPDISKLQKLLAKH
jgi:CRP-like cAMP-binding protein